MLDKFVNRFEERNALEKRWKNDKAEFVVLYGRRRVGKTELIRQFCRDKPHIYLLATESNEVEQLREFSNKIGRYFDEDLLLKNPFSRWQDMFDYLGEKAKKRLILAIDEFPYLIVSNTALPSQLQKAWDENLSDTRIFLILCGSSIGMMEKAVLGYKSPLYGRRTSSIELFPMPFKGVIGFFPNKNLKEQVEIYSVLGGMPAYLQQFSQDMNLLENIRENILTKGSFLYEEIEFILKQELREPRTYFTILLNLAFGKTRVNDIATSMNMDRNKISRYLSTLQKLKIITRELPVTEKLPHKSRKGIYKLNDEFFKFWFRFIFPNRSYIEEKEIEYVIQYIKSDINNHIGFTFEDVCRQALREMSLKRVILPFYSMKIGRWWYKEEEIDIVALQDEKNKILFGECKWSGKPMGMNVIKGLEQKAENVRWKNDKREEFFALFSKAGFGKKVVEYAENNGNCLLFDLDDLAGIFR
ncbi:MAG: ATP-binding protein [Thermoplasmata archaeon]